MEPEAVRCCCRYGEARTRRLPAHVAADVRDVARASGFPGGRRLFQGTVWKHRIALGSEAPPRSGQLRSSGCVLAHRRATWRGISSGVEGP